MLSFIAATYNERDEISDLLHHVRDYVDHIYVADDGSVDETVAILEGHTHEYKDVTYKVIEHTGLPETVKNEALGLVPDGSWVLMLDADERFAPGVLDGIQAWLAGEPAWGVSAEGSGVTHVYFQQIEIIDGRPVREFQKSKLFKKEAITFSTGIHADDVFEGQGLYNPDWVVYHRKSSEKQKQREKEYLATYDRLFEEGKIDEGRRQWLRGLHHYYRE